MSKDKFTFKATGRFDINSDSEKPEYYTVLAKKEGKRIDLGRYDDFHQAVEARRKHEIEFGYYENRGDL